MWKAQRNLGCWYRCYFDTSHPLKHCSSNCKTLPTRSEHITQDTHNPQIPIQSSICSMHQNEPNQQPCPQRDSTASASVPDPQETPKGPCPDVSEPFWQHLRGFFSIKAPVLRGDKKKYPVFEYCVRDMFGFSSFHCRYMLGSWIWSIVRWHILGTGASILGVSGRDPGQNVPFHAFV